MRKVGALVVAFALIPSLLSSAARAQDSDPAAEQAAREIADARDRANAAADAWAAAESQLDQLELDKASVEREIADLQVAVDQLRAGVEEIAVQQFMRAGSRGVPMLTGFEGATEEAQAQVLIDIVNETSAVTFDDFEQADKELQAKKDELERTTADVEAAAAALVDRQAELEQEIERLKATEAQRLKDEAVRRALEAEEAERRRKAQEEADRKAAQAAALAAQQQQQSTATANSGPQNGASAAAPANNAGSDAGADDDRPAPERNSGSSGGATGGTTGGGGNAGLNTSIVVAEGQEWMCPVQGPRAFADTFGAPRSGGRQHQGVDIINPRGTPIVAVVSGFVQQRQNALGGNALWLTGNDGNKYYYAHLDSYGAAGQVAMGDVLGYNGDTGNATGTPHLHFEIHPGGGAAINPYPTTRAHC